MRVTFESPPGVEGGFIVHLAGCLDIHGATVVWETASQLVDDSTRFVVIDFTRVTMLTSAGIGMLVRLYTRVISIDGGLAIFGCNDKIREILTIVMVDRILKVCDSEAEAWQALGTL